MAIFSDFLAILLTASVVSAINIPEVIPGPGLPSLASLNLTSEALHAMGPIEIPPDYHIGDVKPTSKRDNPTPPACIYYGGALIDRANMLSCVNFLYALGTTPCTLSNSAASAQWCNVGNVALYGWNWHNLPTVPSYCSDVAIAAQWVYNNCNYDNVNQWGGWAYVNGNVDIIANVTRQ
ncbi:hypothetical protein V499_04852 [Pseudogymnoascus sp. VKM F-103]|nr:hypothetical protein V499_04852 [Pseudogymnoascus sp. VKM F-103]